jgi:hypothetical protein
MGWLAKVRPQILLIILALTVVAIVGIQKGGYGEVVASCVIGIAMLGPKLIELEVSPGDRGRDE